MPQVIIFHPHSNHTLLKCVLFNISNLKMNWFSLQLNGIVDHFIQKTISSSYEYHPHFACVIISTSNGNILYYVLIIQYYTISLGNISLEKSIVSFTRLDQIAFYSNLKLTHLSIIYVHLSQTQPYVNWAIHELLIFLLVPIHPNSKIKEITKFLVKI